MRKTSIKAPEKVCIGKDLANALAKANLSKAEALAWRRGLKAGRKSLKPPINKWR